MSSRRFHWVALSILVFLLIGLPIHVVVQGGGWVDAFKTVMSLLMLAAFAHFTWIALFRPRTHAVDFGDAGFQDEETPREKPQSPA